MSITDVYAQFPFKLVYLTVKKYWKHCSAVLQPTPTVPNSPWFIRVKYPATAQTSTRRIYPLDYRTQLKAVLSRISSQHTHGINENNLLISSPREAANSVDWSSYSFLFRTNLRRQPENPAINPTFLFFNAFRGRPPRYHFSADIGFLKNSLSPLVTAWPSFCKVT